MCLFQILGQSVVVKFVEENLVEVVHSTWLEKKAYENNVSSYFLIICVKINLPLVKNQYYRMSPDCSGHNLPFDLNLRK